MGLLSDHKAMLSELLNRLPPGYAVHENPMNMQFIITYGDYRYSIDMDTIVQLAGDFGQTWLVLCRIKETIDQMILQDYNDGKLIRDTSARVMAPLEYVPERKYEKVYAKQDEPPEPIKQEGGIVYDF